MKTHPTFRRGLIVVAALLPTSPAAWALLQDEGVVPRVFREDDFLPSRELAEVELLVPPKLPQNLTATFGVVV